MPDKSLTYAEETLGVHEVYDKAITAQNELLKTYNAIQAQKDQRRTLKEQIADREVDVYVEEGQKHATMSKTALEQHVKVQRQKDVSLSALRLELDQVESQIEGLEYGARLGEQTIRVTTARVAELGGYFNYLAAVKSSKPTSQQTQQTVKDQT